MNTHILCINQDLDNFSSFHQPGVFYFYKPQYTNANQVVRTDHMAWADLV